MQKSKRYYYMHAMNDNTGYYITDERDTPYATVDGIVQFVSRPKVVIVPVNRGECMADASRRAAIIMGMLEEDAHELEEWERETENLANQ